ncbi:hypothetical protein J2Y03_001197 [Neobacillus niacini]|uniref:hypothetical protein n=1 Tax=Neobacillus niacini TaxID=86668 RepID=UPI00285FD21C|nr:hypothetical protein [Neobacillus niacini]MDR7076194.1 hypothetical protein [Neobacillus niacini]
MFHVRKLVSETFGNKYIAVAIIESLIDKSAIPQKVNLGSFDTEAEGHEAFAKFLQELEESFGE